LDKSSNRISVVFWILRHLFAPMGLYVFLINFQIQRLFLIANHELS